MDVWGGSGGRHCRHDRYPPAPGALEIQCPRRPAVRARRRTARPDKRGAGAPEPFFFLPGGTLRTDEDAARCARREWEEETGLPCGPRRWSKTFSGRPQKRQHEIGFYTTLKNSLMIQTLFPNGLVKLRSRVIRL
ncbi:NUDIX hydrolase [Deinococcus wulumuqiensis]